MRRAVQALLLFCGTTLVMLLLAEGAVRVFMPQFLRPVFRERVDGAFYMRANLHARIYSPNEFDTIVNTTPQRFRGSVPYTRMPPPGTYRIAVIGDSFVFGTGAPDTECYPRILETMLAQAREHGSVEVLNAGIPNSGIGDQAIWYDRWVSAFHPHLVILTVYGGNDVADEIHDSKFRLASDGTAVPLDLRALQRQAGLEASLQSILLKVPGYDFLTQHSQLLYAVRSAITSLFARRDAVRAPASATLSKAALVAIEKIAAEIRWLKHRVEASGATLAVVFIPPRRALVGAGRSFGDGTAARQLGRRLVREAAQDTIPFLDLTPLLEVRLRAQPGSLYYQRDDHMRPDGYRLIAEAMARFLQAEGKAGE
jgi:lysophospholipase L1-like esterase